MRAAAVALLCAAAIAGAAAAPAAVARMWPGAANCSGIVTFTLLDDGTYDVFYNVSGFLPNTDHGFHVHQYGDITDMTGNSMASHWNPFQAPHACPANPRHVGDMGIITSDANGWLTGTINRNLLNFTFDANTLMTQVDNANALGRGVIIHENTDDCTTQSPPGNAGRRFAIGTIGVGVNQGTVGSMWQPAALSAKLYDVAGNWFGEVWMRNTTEQANSIEVFAKIWNQIPGSIHGFHIHAFGDHSLLTAGNAGTHFNPQGAAYTHAIPYEGMSHMGDLGNVIADNNGVIVHHAFYDNKIAFGGGVMNIIGRAVVLHSLPDQGRKWTADQTGGAGSRLGMGVLGIAQAARFPTAEKLTRQNSIYGFAKLFPTAGRPDASGTVKITAGDDNLAVIQVDLAGLEANMMYAIHVHEFGDLTKPDGTSAGNHYNPYNWEHACSPQTGRRHMGDIGNLPNTTAGGTVSATLFRDWLTLVGDRSIVGRAIVVHRWADDCQTQSPPGNAGSRWLHGIISNAMAPVGNFNGTSGQTGPNYPVPGLMARLSATSTVNDMSNPRGTVYITRDPDPSFTRVIVNLMGIAPNTEHGFHVHTYGDFSDTTGNGAGGHWNPDGLTHKLPSQGDDRHAGDLGNLMADADGNVVKVIRVNNLPLQTLAGRGVVLHELRDQGQSQAATNGAAGLRFSLGALGILSNSTIIPDPTILTNSSSSTGEACPPDQICAGASVSPSLVALLAGAVCVMAVVRRDD